jgi:heat shock protein HtpX
MAIVLVLSVSMRLLGVEPYLNANGLNLTLAADLCRSHGFSAVSFISLAISKWSAKRAMGVQVIETPTNSTESPGCWKTVRTYSGPRPGIKMPEVGVFDTPRGQRPSPPA